MTIRIAHYQRGSNYRLSAHHPDMLFLFFRRSEENLPHGGLPPARQRLHCRAVKRTTAVPMSLPLRRLLSLLAKVVSVWKIAEDLLVVPQEDGKKYNYVRLRFELGLERQGVRRGAAARGRLPAV